MNYYTYMQKIANEVIVQADNGLYYLEPSWRVMLYSANLMPDKVNDTELNWDGVKEWLELQIKKLNTESNKIPTVIDWIVETVTAIIDPTILQEETEFIKNYIENRNGQQDESNVKAQSEE